ncbi:unnamed protein product [Rotaria sp. Silwood1]|nr:unnamed protein product [Rotaria sp. Silwood1]
MTTRSRFPLTEINHSLSESTVYGEKESYTTQRTVRNNRPFVTSSPSNGLETIIENYFAKDPQDPLYGI